VTHVTEDVLRIRWLPALALPFLVLLAGCGGSGGGFGDEDDLCRAVTLAFADNEPDKLVSLMPDGDAQLRMALARAFEETDSGERRIKDDKIRDYYLKQREQEWTARAPEHAAERAALARYLAWRLDRTRDHLGRPRRRDLNFRRFRETGMGESFGDRDVARAEIVRGVIRFQLKDEEFACGVEIVELDRRWYLTDLGECDEVLE
jgi:hypothetical protein